MKKYLIIILLSLLGIPQMAAQESEYVPFVREGVQWVCYYNNIGSYSYKDQYFHPGKNYFTLEIKGDTVIDGKTYKAMHKYSGKAINTENDTVLVYLREEDRIVYGIVPDGQIYLDFYISYGPTMATDVEDLLKAGEEFKLLDFDDPETYYRQVCCRFQHNLGFDELGIDEVALGDKSAKRHKFRIRNMYEYYVIEGVGVDGYQPGYPLSYLHTNTIEPPYYLSHVVEDGKTVYKSVNYGDVAPYDGRMPLAHDGMTWVNEKVIIDHGDTTSCYYTYEIRGDCLLPGYLGGKLCHYYSGDGIDMDNDSIISFLYEGDGWMVNCIDNQALQNVMEEDRNMLNFPCLSEEFNQFSLYYMNHNSPTMMDFYIIWNNRKEWPHPTLNNDNFIMVDPIEVDGYTCYRYAYVDEQGNPICYVTEGIGFDSYDMGDLLTPFTRKPDPDAEYQEYWGLSHVIKDGKIIYKGMRYKEPEPFFGDYNGDGQVNISDVTTLINILLTGRAGDTINDMNGDGRLTISDVTTLINYLLTR